MLNEQIEKFRSWFDQYAATFYGDDEFVNANLKMKECHSHRTCNEMLYLAESLNLSQDQRRIAETVALFHDVGRFKQFTKYRTYNDLRSVDHGQLALEVLAENATLESLEPAERSIIEKAIELHGIKQLPENLTGDTLLMAKLIRDADKLDIYNVVIDGYRRYRENPDSFELEMEFANEPTCSPEVISDVLTGRRVEYAKIKTWNDAKILQLGWVYDVNFAATLKRIKQRQFLQAIFEFLPEVPEIAKLKTTIYKYVDSRIEKEITAQAKEILL